MASISMRGNSSARGKLTSTKCVLVCNGGGKLSLRRVLLFGNVLSRFGLVPWGRTILKGGPSHPLVPLYGTLGITRGGTTWGRLGSCTTIWHFGVSEYIWNHSDYWNHLEAFAIIWIHLESYGIIGIIWDLLGSLGLIWEHLGASGIIWV